MEYKYSYFKRCLDLCIIVLCSPVLIPILFLVSISVKIFLGSPLIFKQIRPGLNGNPFILYKFRSMWDNHDDDGRILPDVDRLGKFGAFLRKTSLDEFPSLWNVLRGDMSLVGPRPLLLEYIMLYTPEQACRHDVKPGITGWAQINGRNAISWNEKFELDVWYVKNQTFLLDLKILILTFLIVLKQTGIASSTSVTMEKFKGSA